MMLCGKHTCCQRFRPRALSPVWPCPASSCVHTACYVCFVTLDRNNTLQLPEQQQQQLDELAARFPACHTILYTAVEEECLGHLVDLLPALSRLPVLVRLVLICMSQPASATVLALALEAVRCQLPWLTALRLTMRSAWSDDAAGCCQFWKALGRATQLQQLELHLGSLHGFNPSQISALSGLSRLARLDIAEYAGYGDQTGEQQQQQQQQQPQHDYSAIRSLTSLRELRLPYMPGSTGLCTISSCTRLRKLCLSLKEGEGRDSHVALDPACCAAIGQLTQLTELTLAAFQCSPPLLEALQRLPRLYSLCVQGMQPATALPVLAQLPQLAVVCGRWAAFQHPADMFAAQLSSVDYAAVHDTTPVAALPNLDNATIESMCQPFTLIALSQLCKKVSCIQSMNWGLGCYTLNPEASAAERTAAIASLASLPRLWHLDLATSDDAEVSALAAVSQLQQLTLLVHPRDPNSSSCSATGLAALGLLSKLQRLTLHLAGIRLTPVEVRGLISSLQNIPDVAVTVSPGQASSWRAGIDLASAGHYRMPRCLCFTVAESWAHLDVDG